MDEASRVQIAAADPVRSTWLTANAGSGKTRVLTDRVARLLLRGAPPERILCLTYTKAAASEMQNRLLARLGEWAMLPDDRLRDSLAALGEGAGVDLAEARRLFARAIETPGGLKVQTIHSFCAGVLRRFPLEAGVPIGFSEIDEQSAAVLRAEIVEELAAAGDPAMSALTELHSGDRLDGFLAQLRPENFPAPADAAAIWTSCGLPPGLDTQALIGRVLIGGEGKLLSRFAADIAGTGTENDKAAARLSKGRWDQPALTDLMLLEDVFLNGAAAKSPFSAKIGRVPTKALQAGACAGYMAQIEDLMRRVETGRLLRVGLAQAQATLALHRFAHVFTRLYAARKAARGWLDFDDLIARTAALLHDPAMALWVLWRLDGGIDHILVDEAQDTSPGQWQVVQALTAEFTSGQGAAAARARTLFVVGDPKQSIYSFQGADVAVFESTRARFAGAFAAIGAPMQDAALEYSFRSSPAVLRLVDGVFAGDAAAGLGGAPRHSAFYGQLPGRVDIWPPVPKPAAADPGDWWQPVDAPAPNDAGVVLAAAVAAQVKAMIGQPFQPVRETAVRAIRPGDILILVQRRSVVFHALISACKQAGVPIAGADRLRLGAELAVRDIRALLQVLATPEDDLSLAAVLRSPLVGLTEDDLYRLAAPRKGYLIEALRSSPHVAARDLLADLAGMADLLRPHDLIARLLIRHGGRARLLARLGPEAEDGIAELMSQALVYETAEVPSLTGFLVWLEASVTEVRRQPGGSDAGLVRVMTVHGAKGLESPVVILPDTATGGGQDKGRTIRVGDTLLWRGTKGARIPEAEAAVAAEKARRAEEARRLLYVGLTRAESWLIVAAAGETGASLDNWHAMVEAGVGRAGLVETPLDIPGIGTGRRLGFGDWPAPAAVAPAPVQPAPAPLPDWAARPAPRVAPPPRPVAATALGGAKALGSAEGADREAAMLRGTRLHLLLEQLAGTPRAQWQRRAVDALAGAEGGLPDAEAMASLIDEAGAVLDAPDLAAVLSPAPDATILREVALTAPWAGGGVLHGSLDLLVVTPDRVTAIDYKSNAEVPASPAAVPAGILRQMAAYRGALRLIYPGREVATAILWTASRGLMPLPDAVLDAAMAALDPDPPAA